MLIYYLPETMGRKFDEINAMVHSPRGRNAMLFCVFMIISAILWMVLALNEEVQRDLRCGVEIVNVPDSVTRVSPMPEALNVSVKARGAQLLRYNWSKAPSMVIDYRVYKSGNRISFSEAALKTFFRNMIGGGSQVLSVNPDSLNIYFTDRIGVLLPVAVDAHVVPGAQYVLMGKPRSLVDSVMVYSMEALDDDISVISTSQIQLKDVKESMTVRTRLNVPKNSRAIPDSIDVRIEVEPLVAKKRMITITPVNVPDGVKLITLPSQVEVNYMVPMSVYKSSDREPVFKVVADYEKINPYDSTDKTCITLSSVPDAFLNVFLSADSVRYIIER